MLCAKFGCITLIKDIHVKTEWNECNYFVLGPTVQGVKSAEYFNLYVSWNYTARKTYSLSPLQTESPANFFNFHLQMFSNYSHTVFTFMSDSITFIPVMSYFFYLKQIERNYKTLLFVCVLCLSDIFNQLISSCADFKVLDIGRFVLFLILAIRFMQLW